ncbi:MAG: SMP-30/gluconolactonase/LRE family protein [Deltaproteobacteria bacterium]|nr:SMP-30/gluconolactonase/LRE family protein [Deltaproteobacteria bacterium]
MKKVLWVLLLLVLIVVAYFLIWPVPVDPVAWEAPENPGLSGPFAANKRLGGLETLSMGDHHGPEDIALDAEGRIYAATHEGHIVRLQADGSSPEIWAKTGGRPLGIDFDQKGNLIVADAYRGLLSIAPDGAVKELATIADGIAIHYADDVDVAADGKIYFSDASTKFGAGQCGGTYEASLLDIMEHGGHGRLLVYDPATGKAKTLLGNLNFANGVAVCHDQRAVLVNETGSYRVVRYWLEGPKKGQSEILIEALPAFPDNISAGLSDRYWIAFVSPRNAIIDRLSAKPFLRKMVQRLPAFMRPKAVPYGHVIAINDNGEVMEDLQDPSGAYPLNTSLTETEDYLYIGSLVAQTIARLSKEKAGL